MFVGERLLALREDVFTRRSQQGQRSKTAWQVCRLFSRMQEFNRGLALFVAQKMAK
jgi:hypothetical protein